MVVNMDQVAPDIAYEISGASSDLSHECIAFYAEVYSMVLCTTKPVFVFAVTCRSVIFVLAVEFSEAGRIRQAFYFDV